MAKLNCMFLLNSYSSLQLDLTRETSGFYQVSLTDGIKWYTASVYVQIIGKSKIAMSVQNCCLKMKLFSEEIRWTFVKRERYRLLIAKD